MTDGSPTAAGKAQQPKRRRAALSLSQTALRKLTHRLRRPLRGRTAKRSPHQNQKSSAELNHQQLLPGSAGLSHRNRTGERGLPAGRSFPVMSGSLQGSTLHHQPRALRKQTVPSSVDVRETPCASCRRSMPRPDPRIDEPPKPS
jgi:hypothetical protein